MLLILLSAECEIGLYRVTIPQDGSCDLPSNQK